MTGFDKPNYTQVPNALFDLLPLMHEAELKVALHAVRQTFGYHRETDAISLTQFEKATGLSRQGVIDGITAATERGVLKEAGTGPRGVKRYRLLVKSVDQSTQATSTSQVSRPELVNAVDTQKKRKETGKKKTHTPRAREEADAVQETQPESYDPRPTDDVAWALGMGVYPRQYGRKADRARQHPLVLAYMAGFPEGERPPIDDAFLAIAERMAERGYAPADVTALVAEKRLDKPGYPLRWCEQDMPAYLARKNAPERPATPKGTGPVPRPSKPNSRVSPLPPLMDTSPPRWLNKQKTGAS